MSTFHACTVVTRAELPAARVLCESLRRHHPDEGVTVLVVDDGGGRERNPSGAQVVSPAGVGVPPEVLARLAMACTAPDLADALTPWLVGHLLDEGAPAVVVLGPEAEVFAPLDDVVDAAAAHGVVLAPRVDGAVPDDGLEPTPSQVEAAGPFARGFVAVGASAAPLVDGWRDGRRLPPPGHVLDDPGCAVSAWNLPARALRAAGEQYEVSGRPLRWFDFHGYAPDRSYVLSSEFARPRALLSDNPALARLCDEHGARLRAAGSDAEPPRYGYGALPDGKPIDDRMRRMYADALRTSRERDEPEPPSPFGPGGPHAFVAWIHEPVAPPTDPRVTRYLTRVWAEDETLQQVFPSLAGEGAEQYMGSLRQGGAADRGIPAWVLPTEEQLLELMKRRWRSRPTGPPPPGVNMVGYVTAVVGVGEVGRVLAAACDEVGVPKVVVANRDTGSNTSVPFETSSSSDAPYDVNLLCVNADHTLALAQQLGPEFFAERRTIGVWFWELEEFPPWMAEAFPVVDEVWVASDFVLESVAAASPKPVRKFPLPVVVPSPPSGVTRATLGVPDGRFVFLFVYDFLSTAERKNPVGLVDAYTQAFGPDDSAALVLKSINGDQRVPELERVRRAAAGRDDIVLLDGYLPSAEHSALVSLCDAYVSLHRSEGFGLDMAKAMGLGKPVIATGYSGNLEFMDDDTAYLVDYDLVPVGPGCEPYPPESRWAQPLAAHAAELMRRVVERPEEAAERGRRAAVRIRGDFSLAVRSREVARMLADTRARRARQGSWREPFMEGWRTRRAVEEEGDGGLAWLPDGTPIDPTMRRLRAEAGGTAPDPEVDLDGFYAWLDERVFPPPSPVVSRYLHRLWCDRPDLQSHFPDLEAEPRRYLDFLFERGHVDTDLSHRLLPSGDDVRRADRYQTWRQRRERIGRAVRTAGQRAAGLVSRR
ncbi:MAG TPA: glycosyltransferase [Acidimicrobiia bacterium]|nr:glycosyltransferase [Acidimicrobiia bacterium]